ncbi:MFS transporter [Roseivirga sp. E12]|uniref:MFS transporter n=1 Tax=Roseivirga sp. E12 TaxID=2819237 RepID=UPI001ABCB2B5|nr:MFS transporter [Roseivirga sp. E12]MBO3697935.1 MFS transporter [Roseivirga sp. E12]
MKAKKALLLFTLMLIGEAVFLLPFVVTRVFRPTFLKVFDINNLELGTAFSLYGIVAMTSYFLGGPIADKYSPKKLLIVSLLMTSLAGLVMAFIPSLATLTLLYCFWGLSTILLFWAGYVKAIRKFGGENTQGRSYGLVDGGRGFVAAVIASSSVLLLDAFLPSVVESATIDELSSALSKIIFVFCGVVAASAVLVWYVFPNDQLKTADKTQKLSIEGVKEVIKRRSIWLQSLILLCSYVGYKCTDDFGLYASVVFGYNDVNSAHIATISFWVRPIAAVAAGVLGDKYGHSKMTGLSFLILVAGSIAISTGFLQPGMEIMIAITIASTSLGIYGLRGLYYALFQESKMPLSIAGSAIGFVSVIGYSPDAFMGPLMGVILDNNPGALGHQYLFGLLAIFGIIGFIASILFRKSIS